MKKRICGKIETLETTFKGEMASATKISLPFDINKIIHVASEAPADSLDKDDLYMRVSHSGEAKTWQAGLGEFSENSDFCPSMFSRY